MRIARPLATFVASLLLAGFLHAQCNKEHDHRSNPTAGVLITDFTITGTQAFGSEELSAIESALTGSCFDENTDALQDRIRALFQDRGFFGVEVNNVRIKAGDPVAVPKPARLEAEVVEGAPFRLAEIKFVGNHAFGTARLRSLFPLKKGSLFARGKIVSGVDSLRNLYSPEGFLDFYCMPNVQTSDTTVTLTIEIHEGPQYRMGKVQVFAAKETADKLKEGWDLAEGATFDPGYLDKYLSTNSSLLPKEFTSGDVQIVRDCPGASVTVVFLLRVLESSESIPKRVACETSSAAAAGDGASRAPGH